MCVSNAKMSMAKPHHFKSRWTVHHYAVCIILASSNRARESLTYCELRNEAVSTAEGQRACGQPLEH